jgi:hypothetical protein
MFLTMIILQIFVMPFVMTDHRDDVYFSVSQGYMGAFMGAAMVAVEGIILHPMPLWAWALTVAIGGFCVVGFRRQWFIGDKEYLHDMIPHHSMAIVTSKARFTSSDPLVRRLAQQIALTQTKEIIDMKTHLRALEA